MAAVDSRGVELGDSTVVATVFRSNQVYSAVWVYPAVWSPVPAAAAVLRRIASSVFR